MPDKLAKYKSMRDFGATAEPVGGVAEAAARGEPSGRFVVQEHSARRLHWDLRLERDGVAVSWAVPKGIPMDPGVNALAVHTEDHPLEYLEWEGVIPDGSYGAGTMKVWDRGTYECEKWTDTKVTVRFHGERVQGRYALFQTRGKDWMLHRMDPPADPAREPMPERLVPMLARTGPLPGAAEEAAYAFEVKWDGVRAIAYSTPGELRLESRNLNDITARYPEVRPLNRELGARDAVLDGEVVAFDEQGRPSFQRLQRRMHVASDSAVRRIARDVPVAYVIFDLLFLDGHSLIDRPYEQRRAALEELALEGPAWRTPAWHRGDGGALLEATRAQGLEGVIAKRLDSRYEPGRRSGAWIKVKNVRRQEVVIGGWLPGEGRRSNTLGALLVGVHEGERLRYSGRVGTGFADDDLAALLARFAPTAQEASPFAPAPRGAPPGSKPPRGARFVEPCLVAEVEFTEWTEEGVLRHPSFKGLRDDRRPSEVVREDAAPSAGVEPPGDRGAGLASLGGAAVRAGRDGEASEFEVEGRRVRLTNLDKVLYPRTGYTKGQTIDFYARIAPTVLAHLRGRPLTMRRFPDGVEAKSFYEKCCPDHRPDWVRTADVWSTGREENLPFCVIDDLPTLLWSANLANLELHTMLAAAPDLDRPTVMAFDLDPGEPAGLLDTAEVALILRDTFAGVGLESFPKTSGSKGMQVYVPLNHPGATYERTKAFARTLAELMASQLPDRVVAKMAKPARRGKVLLDWSQNDRHKSTVTAYSLRARERPLVSTPVTWEEVRAAVDAGDAAALAFAPEQVLERVDELGDLFAPVLTVVQEVPGG